jgi:hypothetical protein
MSPVEANPNPSSTFAAKHDQSVFGNGWSASFQQSDDVWRPLDNVFVDNVFVDNVFMDNVFMDNVFV